MHQAKKFQLVSYVLDLRVRVKVQQFLNIPVYQFNQIVEWLELQRNVACIKGKHGDCWSWIVHNALIFYNLKFEIGELVYSLNKWAEI